MEHRISLAWSREGATFERNNYPRGHQLRFPGGQQLGASAAANYGGDAALADPEQILAAAAASCHMLTFLAVAANRGYVVDAYDDDAIAVLGKNAEGQTFVETVTLQPRIRFGGDNVPSPDDLAKLHDRAHRGCFIANSLRTTVTISPRP